MSIVARLIADHEEFRRLGRSIEAHLRSPAPDGAAVSALVAEFQGKLALHAALEDDSLYPAVRGAMHKSAFLNDAYMNHLDHEHKSIDGHLARLVEQTAGGQLAMGWGQTFAIFSVGLRGHMRREEEELFPEAERLLAAAPAGEPPPGSANF